MSIQDQIKQEVESNDVVLFMKGTPDFPMCGFSGQVAQILNYLQIPYKGVNVLDDGEIRDVTEGTAFLHRPAFDLDTTPVIREWFDRNSTLQFENFSLDDHDLGNHRVVENE